jgi:hypothetical protein
MPTDTLTPSTSTHTMPPTSGHSAPGDGNEEEGVPFDEAHQRQLFEALDSAPDASLDYLHDLARSSAARLAEFVEAFFLRTLPRSYLAGYRATH